MRQVREDWPQVAQGFFERKAIVEGAVIVGAIVRRVARQAHYWPLALHVDPHKGLRFIIAQQHIVAGHVALDHLAFQKEGVHLAFGLDPIRIVDLRYQRHGLVIPPTRILKILPYPVAQHCRLANINHLPAGRLMKVYPRAAGQCFELGVEGGVHTFYYSAKLLLAGK